MSQFYLKLAKSTKTNCNNFFYRLSHIIYNNLVAGLKDLKKRFDSKSSYYRYDYDLNNY